MCVSSGMISCLPAARDDTLPPPALPAGGRIIAGVSRASRETALDEKIGTPHRCGTRSKRRQCKIGAQTALGGCARLRIVDDQAHIGNVDKGGPGEQRLRMRGLAKPAAQL